MKKAFKILLRIIAGILIFACLVLCIIELYPRMADSVTNTIVEGSNNWMAQVSDDKLLSEISIPGAHDAGANNVKLALFSKCQDMGTRDLLQNGYRYLDIRLGIEYVCGEPVMSIYHGFVNCLTSSTIFGSHLYLDNILEDCYAFLDENPTETIVFVVKKEHGDESVSEFEEILSSYTDNEHWLLTDTMPTLATSRGKIVLFRRYDDEANLGTNAGIYLNWDQQKDNSDSTKTFEAYDNNGLTAYVQDRYKYDTDDKWNAFCDTASSSDELLRDGVVINFLSTNGTPTYGHPYKYAKVLNQKFMDYSIPGQNLGWVIVDFGNAEIAHKIYCCN